MKSTPLVYLRRRLYNAVSLIVIAVMSFKSGVNR
jgi:hypothetical protein